MSRRDAASVRLHARTLGRAIVLAVLALEGWGTLLLLVTVYNALVHGAERAVLLLVPSPGTSGWGWVSAFAAGVALLSWTGAAVYVVLSRRVAGDTADSEHGPTAPDEGP